MTKSTASKVAQDVDATVERPTPWEIRTALVRLLADHAEGLTIPDISERVARELGQPIRDPLEPHVESLMTLGVLEESPADNRRLRTTEFAERYLVGAEVLFRR